MTTFHFLVAGMPRWRHALVDFLFAVAILWGAVTMWKLRAKRSSKTTPPSSSIEVATPLHAMNHPASLQFRDEWEKTQYIRARELGLQISEIFTPLQIEAFGIADELCELAISRPRPVFDPRDFGAGEDGKFSHLQVENLSEFSTVESTALYQWQEIRAKYDLSGLKQRATKLYHRFVDEAHIADHHLASLVDSVDTDAGLIDMVATIRKIAFQTEEMA